MCRIDDCEIIEGYSPRTIRSARKAHICDECGRQIEIGESYQRVTGILDHRPFEAKTCGHCLVGAAWLQVNCGGFVHSQIGEELHEHAEEYPGIAAPLLEFVGAMSRRWKAADGALQPIPQMPPNLPVLASAGTSA